MCPDDLFLGGFATCHIDDQARDRSAQVESAIEAIAVGGEVLVGVLAVLQGVEGAGQRGFQVAQHGFDPLELRQVARFERAHHNRQVHSERGQTFSAWASRSSERCL